MAAAKAWVTETEARMERAEINDEHYDVGLLVKRYLRHNTHQLISLSLAPDCLDSPFHGIHQTVLHRSLSRQRGNNALVDCPTAN